MLDKVKEMREDLIGRLGYLNGDIAKNLGLEGEQAGGGKIYAGKNGKGVCTLDLQVLVSLMVHLKFKNIVESGSYTGISSCVLSKVFNDLNLELNITTIEYNKEYCNSAVNNAKKLGLNNIEFVNGNTDEVLADTIDRVKPDLVFLDGDSLSAEFRIASRMCDRIVGHDMRYIGTQYLAPRGVDFIRATKYDGFKLYGWETGECGIMYLERT